MDSISLLSNINTQKISHLIYAFIMSQPFLLLIGPYEPKEHPVCISVGLTPALIDWLLIFLT